jgi:hypothetical protein
VAFEVREATASVRRTQLVVVRRKRTKLAASPISGTVTKLGQLNLTSHLNGGDLLCILSSVKHEKPENNEDNLCNWKTSDSSNEIASPLRYVPLIVTHGKTKCHYERFRS